MERSAPLKQPLPLSGSAIAILTFCCVIWGVGLTMAKIANSGISPLMNVGLRSVAAGLALLIWVWWRGIDIWRRDGTLLVGIFAGLIFSVEFITLYIGLNGTTAARGTVFLHCAPFVAAAGEHFLVPGHRLSGGRLFGLVAAFAGLIIAASEAMGPTGTNTLSGDLLCLAGGICWGLITVLVKTTALAKVPPEKTVMYQLAVSGIVVVPASWLVGEPGITALTPAVLAAFAYTALLTVAFGYTVWFWMMRTYSAASLHAFTFMTPIFGALGGALILGESIGPWTWAGLVLVALGIYLVNRPAPQSR